jgi:hypothetical protein
MMRGINEPDPDPEMEEQIRRLKEQGREEAWGKVGALNPKVLHYTLD